MRPQKWLGVVVLLLAALYVCAPLAHAENSCKVYLSSDPVDEAALRALAKLQGVKHPSHTKLIWVIKDPVTHERSAWQTELVHGRPSGDSEVIGRGDSYVILKKRIGVDEIRGVEIGTCNCDDLEKWMSAYASTRNGDLSGSQVSMQRAWFPEPQGYGGPLYEKATSNTYTSWLLRKLGFGGVAKPEGALGWGVNPTFPGPESR